MNKYPIDKDFKALTRFKSPLNFFGILASRLFWWLMPKGKKNPLVTTKKLKLTNPYDGGKFSALLFEKKINKSGANTQLQQDEYDKP